MLDFETYSDAGYVFDSATGKWSGLSSTKRGLSAVGMAVYAEHPSTDVLTMSYYLDGSIRRWKPGQPLPVDLFDYIARGGIVSAWNSGFESAIWHHICERKYGFPPLPAKQIRCTMAKARAYGLPGALGKAAEVMQLGTQKDKDGERLKRLFCIPRSATKLNQATRNLPAEKPEDAEKLYSYCDTDVLAEMDAGRHIPDLTGEELDYWMADQAINQRGLYVDMPAVDAAISVIEEVAERAKSELNNLTSKEVNKPSEVAKLLVWLDKNGVSAENLDEESVDEILKRTDLSQSVRRVLEIRRDSASAAVKKLYAMKMRTSSDGRARDLFQYHAARTGRCTGSGIQATNLPNSGLSCVTCNSCNGTYGATLTSCPQCGSSDSTNEEWGPKQTEDAISVISTRSVDYIEQTYGRGKTLGVVSSTLRGMLCAAPGHTLMVGDYSSIEAVGLAELAGEQWRRDVFRGHGKIYEMSASMAFGVPVEQITKGHPLRKKGKVMELACGYGGWVGALKAFGADDVMTEDEMQKSVLAWRAASPAIVELWGGQFRGLPWAKDRVPDLHGVEGMAIRAMSQPDRWHDVRYGVAWKYNGSVLQMRLPSGRLLTYHNPRLTDEGRWNTKQIIYKGWNTNPKQGPTGWITIKTHGGKLVENLTQATCRDILRYATINLERMGYPVVLHVYDEIVCELPEGRGDLEEFCEIMALTPDWAKDWPVRVGKDSFNEKRYRK